MAFNFNGNTPKKILYGSANVAKLIYNNVVVWVQKFLSTVTGNTPLTLERATEDNIEEANLYGKCEQRNLPSEYTQVEYVTNTTSTLIDTGLQFDFSKNYEIELKVRGTEDSWYILQARKLQSAAISGITGSFTNNTILLAFNGTSINAKKIIRVTGNIYYIKATINNGNLTLYVKDETAGTEETVTGTYTPITSQSANICLFGNLAGQYVSINSDVYFARIKEDDNCIMDYVPCRQVATAGFYDKASNTFKTTTGLSTGANVVPTPDNPMPIHCNNGELKVNQQGQVYADGTQETITLTHNNTAIDTATVENLLAIDTYKDVQDLISGSVTRNVGILVLDGSENWEIGLSGFKCSGAVLDNAYSSTTPACYCTHFVGVGPNKGASALKDYEIKVGFTEPQQYYHTLFLNTPDFTHDSTGLANLKQWLATQYANGTPVIIVYPLAESTTSSVTSQDLECQEGTNIVSSNKGSRGMEVTYYRN